jgi:hypothetical protein
MKRFLHLPLVAALAFALSGAGCFRNPVSKIELHIPEMSNQACLDAVMAALQPLIEKDASHEPVIDAASRTVTVWFNNVELGRRNLEVAVVHAGFSVNDLPGDPAARAKLPKECFDE